MAATPHPHVLADTIRAATQQSMPLAAGDRLFIYTDGLIEALDRDDEHDGVDRLKSLPEERGGAPLQELNTAVLNDVIEHTGGDMTHDGVTFLAIEIR